MQMKFLLQRKWEGIEETERTCCTLEETERDWKGTSEKKIKEGLRRQGEERR